MVISDYLKEEYCLMDSKSQDKKGIIRELAQKLSVSGRLIDLEKFISDVIGREELGSTGIGNEVAIPHARTEAVRGIVIGFGRSMEGIKFDALDGDKVKLIFLMGADLSQLSLYLRILAELSKLLMNSSFRRELILAQTPREVIKIINKFEKV